MYLVKSNLCEQRIIISKEENTKKYNSPKKIICNFSFPEENTFTTFQYAIAICELLVVNSNSDKLYSNPNIS